MRNKILISILLVLAIVVSVNMSVFAFEPSNDRLYDGIDVSEWQGEIDFEEVARSGVEVVYIRASEGTGYVDPYFRENYEKAKENGLRTGFYHFLTATTVEEAEREAEFFVSNIKGLEPDCRLAMDFEVFDGLGVDEINDISSNITDDLSSTAAKITELNNLNKEIQNKENTTKEISDKKQDFFIEELKKRDTILERYLNPISPGSMNNIMENSINKIANKIQPIYSFPPTRTENVKNTMRPSTIL